MVVTGSQTGVLTFTQDNTDGIAEGPIQTCTTQMPEQTRHLTQG